MIQKRCFNLIRGEQGDLGITITITTYRCTITNRVYIPQRRAIHSKVPVYFNCLLMRLVGQQIANALGERVHSDTSRPEHKISRNGVLFRRPIRVFGGIYHRIWSHTGNTT